MKIRILVEVAVSSDFIHCELEDLDLTKEKWESLSQSKKERLIQDYVDEHNNQPFWIASDITIE